MRLFSLPCSCAEIGVFIQQGVVSAVELPALGQEGVDLGRLLGLGLHLCTESLEMLGIVGSSCSDPKVLLQQRMEAPKDRQKEDRPKIKIGRISFSKKNQTGNCENKGRRRNQEE